MSPLCKDTQKQSENKKEAGESGVRIREKVVGDNVVLFCKLPVEAGIEDDETGDETFI